MKQYILILLVLAAIVTTGNAQEIKWMTMNEALAAQKKQPKKIFLDAYTTWCGPCKMLDRNTFTNEDVIKYINKNYYPVKFNAEGTEEIKYRDFTFTNPDFDPNRKGRNSTHQFARAMKITGYPSLVFFDEKGELIGPIPGYRTPHQLELFLKLFVKEEYKKITSPEAFQAYSETFKNEFTVSN
ncbi:thioredoxin family protein [Salinimicrobium oceani]|uniref:Thioredoxin fold domain-containing protein n=1 Tax=Salinimicrobium oceani TaxID=2722702 RepID=A0ABX1CXZ9_9FLAO|nr:thioredoxin fold domain-containing protein [Salinimicrobium oceani]NJW53134.1 thioredoxin fold domain-containing protein [Salinimicrobium oceani]